MGASEMMSERELLVRIDERQERMRQDFADLVRSTKESIETMQSDVEKRFELQQREVEKRFELQQGRCDSHGKDIRTLKTEQDQAAGKRNILRFILPAAGAVSAIVLEYAIKFFFHI